MPLPKFISTAALSRGSDPEDGSLAQGHQAGRWWSGALRGATASCPEQLWGGACAQHPKSRRKVGGRALGKAFSRKWIFLASAQPSVPSLRAPVRHLHPQLASLRRPLLPAWTLHAGLTVGRKPPLTREARQRRGRWARLWCAAWMTLHPSQACAPPRPPGTWGSAVGSEAQRV